jgi:hypothetical protein
MAFAITIASLSARQRRRSIESGFAQGLLASLLIAMALSPTWMWVAKETMHA